MRLKTLDLVCPKCKKGPTLKKIGGLIYLECNCTKSAGWNTFHYAMSSWIIKVGEMGGFVDYEKIIEKIE